MATISFGGAHGFSSLLYGHQRNAGFDQWLGERIEQASQRVLDSGAQLIEKARETFERVTSSDTARLARAVARQARHAWQTDEIHAFNDIGQMQTAGPVMQRWIMANPLVRTMYHNQQVEGYSDSYVDVEPGAVGEMHYDYRRVMDGIVVEEDGEYWATTYDDELRPDDRELLHEEQVDIRRTWAEVMAIVEQGGDDPTSPWNSSL